MPPQYYHVHAQRLVNNKNVSIFDHLYLDASCLLGSLYYICFYELSFNIYFLVFGLYLVSLLCYPYSFHIIILS